MDEILQTNSYCTRIHAAGLPTLDYASSSPALALHSYVLWARKSHSYVLRPTALCLQMSYPLSLYHQSAQLVTTPHRVTCYFPVTSWCLIQKRYLLICNSISCKNIQSLNMCILIKKLTFEVCKIINNGLMYSYGEIKKVFFVLGWRQHILFGRLLNRNEAYIWYALRQS